MRILIIVVALITFPTSLAKAADTNDQKDKCLTAGALALANWHNIDFCVVHGKILRKAAIDLQGAVAQKYPKLKNEIDAASPLSEQAKAIAWSSPFDFEHGHNSQLLSRMCTDTKSVASMLIKDKDWTTQLACWQ